MISSKEAKEQFLSIYGENIQRSGADALLEWLKKSDFFKAPASTRFHLCREGGLCEHSINVYNRLTSLLKNEPTMLERFGAEIYESVAICGLLHDLCKVNFYKTEMRNKKNDAGKWESVPFYVVDDRLPYGHGEKSVYIVSGFMKLSREEAMAIRWHMGGFDDSVKGGSYAMTGAFEQFPLALLLNIADMQATYLDEVERGEATQ